LDPLVHKLFDQGISTATRAVYQSGWRQYQKFCIQFNVAPLKTPKLHLLLISPSRCINCMYVHTYVPLDSTRYEQAYWISPCPLPPSSPTLSRGFRGFCHAAYAQRLPIAPSLLLQVHTLWSKEPVSFDRVMLWVAFCLGFFGFMCSGEFTTSLSQDPNECTLSVSNVAVNSRQEPQAGTPGAVSLR